jgi:hypothetical protein
MGSIDHFLYRVESLDDLPEAVQAAIQQHQLSQSIQGIVVIPPQQYATRRASWLGDLPFGWRNTPRRTLVFGSEQLAVLAIDSRNRLTTTIIPLAALTEIELTLVLLYAYVQFTWASAGSIETIKIEFNSVGEPVIREQLASLRDKIIECSPHPRLKTDSRLRASIADLPLKFHNYLNLALLPREEVFASVYQPAMRRHTGWFRPLLSANRTVAVTTHHVLLVEDEFRPHADYSVITRFLPMHRIQRVIFEPTPDAIWMGLLLGTAEAMQPLSIPLEPEAATTLRDAFCQITEVPVDVLLDDSPDPDDRRKRLVFS